MKTIPRRIAIGASALLALAAAGVLIGELAGWPFLRQPLQDQIAKSTGVPVLIEAPFRARFLFQPQMQVGHLRMGPGGGVDVPHLVDAQGLDLHWRWRDVWRWRSGQPLRIAQLHAAVLDAHLVRQADGRASWQLGQRDPAPDAAGSDTRDGLPRFGSLQLQQGVIRVDDRPLQTQLRIDIQGGEGDAPAGGSASPSASRSASVSTPERAHAGYQARVQGRYRALPLDLNLRTGGALPFIQDTLDTAAGPSAASQAEGGQPSPMLALRVEGRAGAAQVFFDGQAGALLGARQLSGAVRVRGPSLALVGAPLGVTLPDTPPFDLRGHLAHDAGVWHLQAEEAVIGRSRLHGDFRHDTRTTPPRLSGRLNGPRLALADLGPSVGAPTPAPAKKTPVAASAAPTAAAAATAASAASGRVLPQRRFDLPSLKVMDADVQIALDELDFGTAAVAPLRQLRTHLLLKGGVLELQQLQAQAAGGRFAGSTRLDAAAQPARFSVDVRFDGVDIAGWLRGLRKTDAPATPDTRTQALKAQRDQARQGGDQSVLSYISGTLGGHVKLTGAGQSTAQILATLDGSADLTVRDGTLSHLITEALGLDIAQGLGVLVRGDRPLPLRCARMDVAAEQGVLKIRRAVFDNSDSTLRVGGQVDLRNETLALEARSQPKDISPLALRTPVRVSGTLAQPQIGIDGKRLAGKVLGSVILGAVVAPLAALLPLVDRGTDEGDPCIDVKKTTGAATAAAAKAVQKPTAVR